MMMQLLPFIPRLITKLGADGILLAEILPPSDPRLTDPDVARYIVSRCTNESEDIGCVYLRHFPVPKVIGEEEVVSVNGVGDTFLGVLVTGLARGVPLGEDLINVAQRAAGLTLRSKEAVSPELGLGLGGSLMKLKIKDV